nr:flagellar hook-basal body complex protein [Bacillus niameyensis]
MIRSMYSGISGMKNFQTKLDVIGNNIANVNTYGFKKGRVTFKDMVSQTVMGASGPTQDKGGKNPIQVGLGAQLAAIDTVDTQGSMQTTGRVLDLGIQGDGYLVVSEGTPAGDSFFATSTYYTRAGNLYLNNQGYLVTGAGHYVMSVNPDDNSLQPVHMNGGNVQEIQSLSISEDGKISFIKEKGLTVAEKTQEIAGKISAAAKNLVEDPTSLKHVDSLVKLTNEMKELSTQAKREADLLQIEAQSLKAEADVSGDQKAIQAAQDAQTKADSAVAEAQKVINAYNQLNPNVNSVYSAYQNYKGNPNETTESAVETAAKTALTSANDLFTQSGITADSVALAIDAIEYVKADKLGLMKEGDLYTTNHSIALAKFANPGGLEKIGENLYVSTANAGETNILVPGSVGAGSIISGALEMSNVDLSEEFTEMIVAQRGFQANTRIITTSDEILQELVNLKR